MENKNCYINPNTQCIYGRKPKNMATIIALWNTWVCFIEREYILGQAFAFSGIQGHAYVQDTRQISKILVKICNGEESPSLGLLKLNDIKTVSYEFDIYPKLYVVEEYSVKGHKMRGFPMEIYFDIIKVLKFNSYGLELAKIGFFVNAG